MNESNSVLLGLTLDHIASSLKKSADRPDPGRIQAMKDAWEVFEKLGAELSPKLTLSSSPQWPNIDDKTFEPYIKKAFSEIRGLARGAEQKAASAADDDPCHSYVSSLRWLLKSMQILVESFHLDGTLVDADSFNAMTGSL